MWTTCEKKVQLPQDYFGARDLKSGPGMYNDNEKRL